jgi:hypothetical protein
LAAIRIEIYPPGLTHVAIAQPRGDAAANRLWGLYRALRPQIAALEQAARREAARPAADDTEGGR